MTGQPTSLAFYQTTWSIILKSALQKEGILLVSGRKNNSLKVVCTSIMIIAWYGCKVFDGCLYTNHIGLLVILKIYISLAYKFLIVIINWMAMNCNDLIINDMTQNPTGFLLWWYVSLRFSGYSRYQEILYSSIINLRTHPISSIIMARLHIET